MFIAPGKKNIIQQGIAKTQALLGVMAIVVKDNLSEVFKLASALHEWNYQNATDVGTTVTMPDTGSIGTLPMSNPDAASEPTLQIDGVYFDGVAEYVENAVVDFRSSDTSGILHTYFYFDGTAGIIFCGYEDASNYIILNVVGGNLPQFLIKVGGTNYILRGSNSINIGWNCISAVQNDTVARLYINGIVETSYSTDTTAGGWFDLINTVSINFAHIPPTNYYLAKIKYISYAPYVDSATGISEQNEIVQGLTTFNPLTIEGLELYLNWSNATAASWQDQSTNGFNFEQGTGTKQPAISTYSVDYDGTDDIQAEVVANPFGSDASGIIFFSGYNTGNLQRIFASSDNASANDWIGIGISTNNIYLYVDIGGIVSFNVGTTTIPLGYYYGYIKSTGTAYEFNINGASETFAGGIDNGNFFADVPNRDTLELGGVLRNSPLYGDAQINKIIYSNAALTSDQIEEVNNFMSNPLT